ncbi:ATP-dependent nuclease [Niallia taxi]|uniref:ATP-dependent nuclease n=1 Tax=Niallia taxi TaxID=2499688 RepID=UPI002E1A68C6|nr:AAA family ATPase [Niallia taxi]
MEIKWFEIKNYKSIKDSGRCYLNNNMNLLAGKNESGKSSILQALKAFYYDEFPEEHYRITETEIFEPEVKISFKCSSAEIKEIFSSVYKYKFDEVIDNKNLEIFVIRGPYGTEYGGSAIEFLDFMVDSLKVDLKHELSIISTMTIEEQIQFDKVGIRYQDIRHFFEGNDYPLEVNHQIAHILDQLKELDKSIDYNDIEEFFPRFIYFDTFEDLLPSEVNVKDSTSSDIVQRLFSLLSINPDDLISSTSSHRKKWILRNAATKISGDFGDIYSQNEVSLKVDIDGNNLLFSVQDGFSADNSPLSTEQRSQGFQWFLSFYITLEAEKLNNYSLILIDEPGLYLHATAQKDMLKILEKISKKHKVLFSTHSPYLLNPSKLDRIQLVLKDKETNLTTIEPKIQKVADKETLTPIITAIGYDISQGIGYDKKFNIICEGISDYYYLSAFYKLVNKSEEFINIIPAVGADQIPNISSILFGWGLTFVALVDNDAQGQGVQKKLLKNLQIEENAVIFVNDVNGNAIEDIFSKEDFYKYVLCEPLPKDNVDNNSKIISGKYSKVLLAKNFLLKVESNEVILGEVSLVKIRNLLEKLNVGLGIESNLVSL